MHVLTIILMILTIASFTATLASIIADNSDATVISVISFIVIGVSSVISYYCFPIQDNKEDDIPAIEVYRGNTTLQVIYQDSIPVDSVVVYKH